MSNVSFCIEVCTIDVMVAHCAVVFVNDAILHNTRITHRDCRIESVVRLCRSAQLAKSLVTTASRAELDECVELCMHATIATADKRTLNQTNRFLIRSPLL